jgi:hypothetical protein
MPNQIDITTFTPEAIVSDQFIDVFAEYYELRTVIESQGWHDNQSVFDHQIKSGQELETILDFDYLTSEEKSATDEYLGTTYDILTRRQLLRLATLLHDIGKLVSLQTNAQGNTGSPSHGIIGGWVASEYLQRFSLTEKERAFILSLISDHLVPSDLIELSINNHTEPTQIVSLLTSHRSHSATELLLLSYADWMGCDIRESVREEREKRITIAHMCLASLAKDRGIVA